jgi:hypothetical protein
MHHSRRVVALQAQRAAIQPRASTRVIQRAIVVTKLVREEYVNETLDTPDQVIAILAQHSKYGDLLSNVGGATHLRALVTKLLSLPSITANERTLFDQIAVHLYRLQDEAGQQTDAETPAVSHEEPRGIVVTSWAGGDPVNEVIKSAEDVVARLRTDTRYEGLVTSLGGEDHLRKLVGALLMRDGVTANDKKFFDQVGQWLYRLFDEEEAATRTPPREKDPIERRGAQQAMVHFLFPQSHAEEGKESQPYKMAVDAINKAQTSGLNGAAMLSLYANVLAEILEQKIPAPAQDPDRLSALMNEAERGSALGADAPAAEIGRALQNAAAKNAPFLLSFAYGGHQTYLRLLAEKGKYRLEYFDRQRPTMTLRAREVPGYFEGKKESGPARPMWFEFTLDPSAVAALCARAQTIAKGGSQDERADVLSYLADNAANFDVFGELEPAQHPDAVNCAWASLESVIRTFHGVEAMRGQLLAMRQLVVMHYLVPHGDDPERAIGQHGIEQAALTDEKNRSDYGTLNAAVTEARRGADSLQTD